MKIGIVGAGAMGSVYGGILGDAGNEVWLVDVWREHVDAIRKNGVRVEGASGDRTVRVNATTDPREAGRSELAVLVGGESLLVGVAGGFGASVVAPGHVHHHGWEVIALGEFSGGITGRLQMVAETWKKAGFRIEVVDDIQPLIWGKLMANAGFAAICAVTGQRVGQVQSNEWSRSIVESLVSEAAAVARAKKIRLPYDDPVRWVKEFGSRMSDTRPSMLQDVEAGRPTEIDSLNGAIAREAERLGIPAPVNRLMTTLMKALEEKTRRCTWRCGGFSASR